MLPRLFTNNYGHTLSDTLEIELGGGFSTKVYYCGLNKKIYGLDRFIKKYYIDDEYVFVFNYLGQSKFALSVYDSQCMNHLRDEEGNVRMKDFIYPLDDREIVFVSDGEEDVQGIVEVLYLR